MRKKSEVREETIVCAAVLAGQSGKGWGRTFLARTGQEIGAPLIVGIMNKVPTAPLLFAVIPVAYTRAPAVASLYQAASSSLSLSSSLSP